MESLIRRHQLAPHPEGGFYRETYRAAHSVGTPARSACTAIIYLLGASDFSALHRIDADELWHFYRGDPLCIVELQPGGPAKQTLLSHENPQHVVPRGTWFGSMPAEGSAYSLVGCTVAPGFEFSAFEIGTRAELHTEFPHALGLIDRLTRVAR